MEKCCKNCQHFEPYWDEGDKPPFTGVCKCSPPVWIGPHPATAEDAVNQYYWAFPYIGAYAVCGKWAAISQKEELKPDYH